MYGERYGSGPSVPVNVGDELTVKIEAVGEKGDGVAKKDGFVLFIPGTKEGQEVKVRITKVFSKVGFAEVVGAGEASAATEKTQPEEPAQEDTEDFGEEAPAEESSKEPAEEEAPEAPAEEAEATEEEAPAKEAEPAEEEKKEE